MQQTQQILLTNIKLITVTFAHFLLIINFLVKFKELLNLIFNFDANAAQITSHYILPTIIFKQKMQKKRNSKSTNKISSFDAQFQISADMMSQQFVKQKRQKKKKVTKHIIAPGLQQGTQVIDIKRGDTFIRQHYTPDFLKKWDGQSNQLQISQEEVNSLSPMMQVYWQRKSKAMKSVIFVQIGSTDFLCFEKDAILISQIFKRPLRKFSIFLMVSFWKNQMDMVKLDLFERNIPVMIMTQIDDQDYKEKNNLILRQITQIITPSLYTTIQPKSYNRRLLLAIIKGQSGFGVVAFQSQSNRFYTEAINGQQNFHQVRRIINRYRPVQLILPKRGEFINVFKGIAKTICNPFIIQVQYHRRSFKQMIAQFLQITNGNPFFRQIRLLFQEENQKRDQKFSKFQLLCCLDLVLTYLTNLNMANKILGQGIFQILPFQKAKLKPIFDSQVYQNLQIFKLKNEQNQPQGSPGTLIAFMDRCNTHGGKKLLRRWIDQPLRSAKQIKQRQQAILQLQEKDVEMNICWKMHNKFTELQKLEKQVANVYHWVQQNNEKGKLKLTNKLRYNKQYNQDKNPAVKQLKQINKILQKLQGCQQILKQLSTYNLKSSLLKRLANVRLTQYSDLITKSIEQMHQQQGIPQISNLTRFIKSQMLIDGQKNLEPTQGTIQSYDEEKKAIEQIQEKLDQQLNVWKQKIKGGKITYVSVRARNQIQILKSALKGQTFKQLIYSSETKDYIRFTCANTVELTQQLVQHEARLAQSYQPFLIQMVLEFSKYKYLWDWYVNSISQLDVLISMVKVGTKMATKCMPKFTDHGLKIINGVHPGLLQVNKNVIPNSLIMQKDERVLLLTGPNMGGKSTILRQTCLLAIMAQIGSFVPAETYEAIVFDQIFCRIGASDRIIQGKSTFYVQLQETQRILSQSTQQSLVIIDELGRGTSTYDGMAIANAVLRQLIQETYSYTLFSTHYKPVTDWFSNDPNVKSMKMGYQYSKDRQSLNFTYQLQKGVAQKSFANNVARMVGLPQQIIKIAQEKAETILHHDSLVRNNSFAYLIDNMQLMKLEDSPIKQKLNLQSQM